MPKLALVLSFTIFLVSLLPFPVLAKGKANAKQCASELAKLPSRLWVQQDYEQRLVENSLVHGAKYASNHIDEDSYASMRVYTPFMEHRPGVVIYRGMQLSFEGLKEILLNGVKVNKRRIGKTFLTYSPWHATYFAFFSGGRPPRFPDGYVYAVFQFDQSLVPEIDYDRYPSTEKDIPAAAIRRVWVYNYNEKEKGKAFELIAWR